MEAVPDMFGLVLAIGIVVDDAIVVVEAVIHHLEHGLAPKEATFKAMEEVTAPVIGIALILSAVFVPVALLAGLVGSMSGINPQGCQVFSFKGPSSEDLDHDFLWRCSKSLPERGRIGIFNRSYYEETLVVRVHPEILKKQKLPRKYINDEIFNDRFEDIRNYEKYLARNGTVIRKFFLHLSKDEQKRRFLSRLDDPDKNWKFSANDAKERGHWKDYMDAYEDTIRQTATKYAPWYVVPADNKWFTRVVVASAVIDALASLDLAYPKVDEKKLQELSVAREALAGKAAKAAKA